MENKKEVKETNEIEREDYNSLSIDSFEDLGLKNELLRGIYSYGFEKPSAIQKKSIILEINLVLEELEKIIRI